MRAREKMSLSKYTSLFYPCVSGVANKFEFAFVKLLSGEPGPSKSFAAYLTDVPNESRNVWFIL